MTSWHKVLEALKLHCHSDLFISHEPSLEECLIYLYTKQKMSTQQIASLTNNECCNRTIANKMRELGIKLRRKGGPNNTKVTFIPLEEYKTLSYDQLALKYKVERTTIYKHVKQYIKTNGKREGRPKLD